MEQKDEAVPSQVPYFQQSSPLHQLTTVQSDMQQEFQPTYQQLQPLTLEQQQPAQQNHDSSMSTGEKTTFDLAHSRLWFTYMWIVVGSSHSDKELDSSVVEKGTKTIEKRKRKRKADDSGDKAVNGKQTARTSDCKKINDYFVKNTGNSPVRHGAKPSSPAHPAPLSLVSIIVLSTWVLTKYSGGFINVELSLSRCNGQMQ